MNHSVTKSRCSECEFSHYSDPRLGAVIPLQFINGENQLPSSTRNERRLSYDERVVNSKKKLR